MRITAAKRVLAYLKATSNKNLILEAIPQYNREKVETYFNAYSDADFANEKPGRKSTTGHIIKCGASTIFWRSLSQRLVTLSTAEAEYVALAHLVKELKYLNKLVECIYGKKIKVELAATYKYTTHCDNQAAIAMSKDLSANALEPSTSTSDLNFYLE